MIDSLQPAFVVRVLALALPAVAPARLYRHHGWTYLYPERGGLKMTGVSPDGVLPEIVEREDHPWFIGVQFHPKLKSRPFAPHPLFASFIAAALEQSRLV